ncbi:centrosomal protein of 126 kDa isoform X2 [Melanotaenia boesemani]|nr:centrosomal protein of 126 kDa isoform X2 [Melanotaenia boesemani]XP_041851478.1 centrosomal protein of 126 kDa isoform X2 [Melanotaenia boesemani]
MQEQRLRENILQQRRQQIQDATERFQRAHLPPSQRYRSFQRNDPNIEDALSQLQGTLSSYTGQPPFLSSNSNISRICTPSPKSPTVSKSSHRQALSAVEAYTKLLQEQSRTERYQDHSPQGSHLSDCCNSESLSSKDSLENEDLNQSTINPQSSNSSFFLDCEKTYPDLRKQNYLCPTSDLTSVSATILPNENDAKSRKLYEPEQEKQDYSEWPRNFMHSSKASWGFISVEKTPETESCPTVHHSNSLTLCEITTGDPEYLKCLQDNPSENINVTDQVFLGNTTAESSYPKQEALLDLKQQRPLDDRQLKYPPSTDIPFPPKKDHSKNIWFGASANPDHFLEDSTANNLSNDTFQQIGKENHSLSSKKEPSASINNLNKVSDSECKTSKPVNAVSLPHSSSSNVQVEKCPKFSEKEQKFPVSVATSPSVCEVRLMKGILKKQSKYMSRDITCMYGSEHLIFSKQVALAIRDSVELSRAKTKDMEVSNTIKKKLRWFDEVHKDAEEHKILQHIKGKSYSQYHPKINLEDHQLSLTTDLGSSKPGPNMTPAASTGYHLTKEAWTDVGVQVNLPQEQTDEVKVPQSSTRGTGPKVPRRERLSRIGAGPVSTRTRKGTVIRPQSATEVSQIVKTQGKIMVPRPPPRIEVAEEMTPYITETPYGMDHSSINYKQALVIEQALCKKKDKGFFSPKTYPVIATDSTGMYTTQPHSYACPLPEASMKNMPISGHLETQNNRRGTVYNEKAFGLDCTPTDEEISQLWHGVRSALITKDAKTMGKRQDTDSRRVLRKSCTEQSRQPPGSGSRRLLQTSQTTKQTTELTRTGSGSSNTAFTKEGLLEEKRVVAAMETSQTHRSGTVQQHSQQQGLTTTSSEEKKILLSLDRLNHQLHCLQEHMGGNTGTCGLAIIDAHFTREVSVAKNYMHHTSAANRLQYPKKF